MTARIAASLHKQPCSAVPVSACDSLFWCTVYNITYRKQGCRNNRRQAKEDFFTQSSFFAPPLQWAFYRRFAASFAVLHTSTAFSLLLLPALASPSFSSAFCSLYYFWPLGRGYSHGDTDKAIRTLNGGSTLLIEGRFVSTAKSRALPHVPLWLHFKNRRKNFKCFDPAELRRFCVTVRLSERNNCRTTGLIFMKFGVGNFHEISSKIPILMKIGEIKDVLVFDNLT